MIYTRAILINVKTFRRRKAIFFALIKMHCKVPVHPLLLAQIKDKTSHFLMFALKSGRAFYLQLRNYSENFYYLLIKTLLSLVHLNTLLNRQDVRQEFHSPRHYLQPSSAALSQCLFDSFTTKDLNILLHGSEVVAVYLINHYCNVFQSLKYAARFHCIVKGCTNYSLSASHTLSIHLFIYVFIFLKIYIYLPTYLSIYLFINVPLNLFSTTSLSAPPAD